MVSSIEPLYKSVNAIKFGWARESGAVSYNIYVGKVESPLTLLVSNIADVPSEQALARGKVYYEVAIADVRTTLSLAATVDFSNTVFFFAITYVNSGGAESSLSDSTIVEVPPVGIISKPMKDDPTIRRHPFVFSDGLQRWVKQVGSASGAMVVDTSDYYKTNITTEYTYDGTNLKTALSYLSDATTGSPAKLTTYTYSGSQVTKMEITDTTATI